MLPLAELSRLLLSWQVDDRRRDCSHKLGRETPELGHVCVPRRPKRVVGVIVRVGERRVLTAEEALTFEDIGELVEARECRLRLCRVL